MDFIKWEKIYETGLPIIDAQHKKLFAIINNYHRSEISTGDAFNELKAYINFHFKTEEYYFDKFNYIFSKEHKKAHEYYSETVQDMYKRYLQNDVDPVFKKEIEDFIRYWITDHIQLSDMLYVPCFSEHATEFLSYEIPPLKTVENKDI